MSVARCTVGISFDRFSIATGSNARTCAPASSARCISVMLGASRMSSVRGLNATPQKASVRPFKPPGNSASSFCQKCVR